MRARVTIAWYRMSPAYRGRRLAQTQSPSAYRRQMVYEVCQRLGVVRQRVNTALLQDDCGGVYSLVYERQELSIEYTYHAVHPLTRVERSA
ncbi:hypothetical protein LMG28138_03876 [Pararobbsia alpina]|uniref:Uncharacterized protein n=1 Tax=Pararobbsia alpina TaxID=621374 RepID=A0A6S7BV57_9BURK|nr:hypothetical protein LMG28138_03876 [Pararobbsia alpina]